MSDETQSATEEKQSVKTGWTSTQVYALSLLCLLIGISVGYLFRGSTTATTPSASAPIMDQPQMGAAGPMGTANPTGDGSPMGAANPGAASPMGAGNSMGAGGAPANAQPGPEQMKAMAEKKVAPLLEELKANPKDTDLLSKIGTFYLLAGQYEESMKYFEKATVIKPSADSWTKLSNAQAYGGSADKAIESLNKALKLDPNSANALYDLGMVKWQAKGDAKGAIACWEKLVKTNPNHPQIDQVKKLIEHAREMSAQSAAKQ